MAASEAWWGLRGGLGMGLVVKTTSCVCVPFLLTLFSPSQGDRGKGHSALHQARARRNLVAARQEVRLVDESNFKRLVVELETGVYESAACALRAMGPDIVPALQEEFGRSDSPDVRRAMVEIIDHFRRREDLPFFAKALMDDDGEVWQAAIDALVSQPCDESLALLRVALRAASAMPAPKKEKWNKVLFLEDAVSELQKPNPYGVGGPDET